MKVSKLTFLLIALCLTITQTHAASSKFTSKDFLLKKDTSESHIMGRQCPGSLFHVYFSKTPPGKYIIEEHTVQTPDGYLLKLFRVNLSESEKAKLPQNYQPNLNKPVLMMHGMESSSDGFFMTGTEDSAGFYIVNKGFDVWVGNSRGNKYSHSHINPKITEAEFFDFSWEEMGRIDLPALYKHILTETNAEKLTYIGYSQGTTQLFVGLLDDESREYLTP